MAKNITVSGAATVASDAEGLLIQVNAALTGNIVVQAGGVTIATITNPTVGSQFKYGGLTKQGVLTVNPSASCDITVTILQRES